MNTSKVYLGAGLIAIAGIIFFVFVMPMYDDISNVRIALKERSDLLNGRNAIMDNINQLNKQYQSKSADVQRLSFIIPKTKSAAEIVSGIQDISFKNGLQLTALALGDQQADASDPYRVQSIDIGVTGSYLSFKSFMNSLEQNIRLMDITSITGAPASEGSAAIAFRVKANAYFLNSK